jgi:alkylation response protein AidB-like acyl-CoA dehydrogenase
MSAALEDDARAESIRMIRDSAAAVAPPGGDLSRIRGLRFQAPGHDPATFRQMGEMGWIGLRVPEAQGGAGLGLGEACALAEELGAALVPEPLIPAMLSASLLAAVGGSGAGTGSAGGPLEALLTGAYLLGGMERAFAMTIDYLKTRSQFGKIIGTFQALQHKAADVKMQIALTRASIEAAAATLDEGATGDLRRATISRAKARAAESAMVVTRQCIQLHGGIGYTDDYDVGLYLRKAMVMANQYGSATLHRRRFMATSPETDE